jgi:hypothetical protein
VQKLRETFGKVAGPVPTAILTSARPASRLSFHMVWRVFERDRLTVFLQIFTRSIAKISCDRHAGPITGKSGK